MNIKISYKKNNGETGGYIIKIENDGAILVYDPGTNTSHLMPYWLSDYEKGSAVILGVDEDD